MDLVLKEIEVQITIEAGLETGILNFSNVVIYIRRGITFGMECCG
jgi:hypothetical protein